MSITITKDNFNAEVLESDIPVLIDFWAEWCAPCKMVAPIIDDLAEEVKDKAKVGKINVDESMELAQSFSVFSIPTIVVFKNGNEVNRAVGVRSKEDLLELLSV